MSDGGRIAVIGVGNPLMGDDGFGLAVLDVLREHWELDDAVELEDGGTWGMNLLPSLEDSAAVIMIDAVDIGWPSGTPVELERDSLELYLGTKLSPHEIGLRDVITLAELRGRLPQRFVVIGVQPERIRVGIGLSPHVAAQVEDVAQMVGARLRRWGWHAVELAACTR